MRNLTFLAALSLVGASGVVQAAPPKCDKTVTVDCLNDDVLVLNGDFALDGRPLVQDPMDTMGGPCKDPLNCKLNYEDAVTRALQVIGGVPDNQWDQLVIFGQQIAPSTNAPGPLFFRQGVRAGVDGVNEVDGIGLPVVPRTPGRPFVGYVAAGSTAQPVAGTPPGPKPLVDPIINKLAACGRTSAPAAAVPAMPIPALCYPGFYNYFDALAQATGSIFGPYLKGEPGATAQNNMALPSVLPSSKAGLVNVDDKTNEATVKPSLENLQPRVWNSLLNLRGSLFAGNYYRDNGNGTFETTSPPPFYGINVPFPAAYKAGTVVSGTQILRFQPLDLYVMGLLPADATELQTIQSFMKVKVEQVYRPTVGNFNTQVGPQMGFRPGVAVRPPDPKTAVLAFSDIVGWNGARTPAFDQAPHALKQLWVVVTKPQALIDATAKPDDMADLAAKRADAAKHLVWVTMYRRAFSPYYYMLTGYRGRVITTFDGVDDNAYWEFGQPLDDLAALQPTDGSVKLEIRGPENVPNSPEIKTALRFTAVGPGAGVRFGSQVPLRILGDQTLSVPYNAVTARMRIPPGVDKAAFATVTLDGGPTIRIPASCGNPKRPNCTEAAFLVPDGKWRNYSASLADSPDFTMGGKIFTGFTFSPSSAAFTATDANNPDTAIEVEFIRIGNLPSVTDKDSASCVLCSACDTLDMAVSKTACTQSCQGKSPNGLAEAVLNPDGWLDSEDNCPTVFNPLQADGNNDGIGDDCEDFDVDGKLNSCDNCPTNSNSRQRDQNGNGIGDVCDAPTGGCFLTPDTMAGRMPEAPSALFSLGFGAVIGLLAFRRRRRR
jgi:Thrombospondin type 3 repeat